MEKPSWNLREFYVFFVFCHIEIQNYFKRKSDEFDLKLFKNARLPIQI